MATTQSEGEDWSEDERVTTAEEDAVIATAKALIDATRDLTEATPSSAEWRKSLASLLTVVDSMVTQLATLPSLQLQLKLAQSNLALHEANAAFSSPGPKKPRPTSIPMSGSLSSPTPSSHTIQAPTASGTPISTASASYKLAQSPTMAAAAKFFGRGGGATIPMPPVPSIDPQHALFPPSQDGTYLLPSPPLPFPPLPTPGSEHEHPELAQLRSTNASLTRQNAALKKTKEDLLDELENLSIELFSEANEMVAKERKERAKIEEELREWREGWKALDPTMGRHGRRRSVSHETGLNLIAGFGHGAPNGHGGSVNEEHRSRISTSSTGSGGWSNAWGLGRSGSRSPAPSPRASQPSPQPLLQRPPMAPHSKSFSDLPPIPPTSPTLPVVPISPTLSLPAHVRSSRRKSTLPLPPSMPVLVRIPPSPLLTQAPDSPNGIDSPSTPRSKAGSSLEIVPTINRSATSSPRRNNSLPLPRTRQNSSSSQQSLSKTLPATLPELTESDSPPLPVPPRTASPPIIHAPIPRRSLEPSLLPPTAKSPSPSPEEPRSETPPPSLHSAQSHASLVQSLEPLPPLRSSIPLFPGDTVHSPPTQDTPSHSERPVSPPTLPIPIPVEEVTPVPVSTAKESFPTSPSPETNGGEFSDSAAVEIDETELIGPVEGADGRGRRIVSLGIGSEIGAKGLGLFENSEERRVLSPIGLRARSGSNNKGMAVEGGMLRDDVSYVYEPIGTKEIGLGMMGVEGAQAMERSMSADSALSTATRWKDFAPTPLLNGFNKSPILTDDESTPPASHASPALSQPSPASTNSSFIGAYLSAPMTKSFSAQTGTSSLLSINEEFVDAVAGGSSNEGEDDEDLVGGADFSGFQLYAGNATGSTSTLLGLMPISKEVEEVEQVKDEPDAVEEVPVTSVSAPHHPTQTPIFIAPSTSHPNHRSSPSSSRPLPLQRPAPNDPLPAPPSPTKPSVFTSSTSTTPPPTGTSPPPIITPPRTLTPIHIAPVIGRNNSSSSGRERPPSPIGMKNGFTNSGPGGRVAPSSPVVGGGAFVRSTFPISESAPNLVSIAMSTDGPLNGLVNVTRKSPVIPSSSTFGDISPTSIHFPIPPPRERSPPPPPPPDAKPSPHIGSRPAHKSRTPSAATNNSQTPTSPTILQHAPRGSYSTTHSVRAPKDRRESEKDRPTSHSPSLTASTWSLGVASSNISSSSHPSLAGDTHLKSSTIPLSPTLTTGSRMGSLPNSSNFSDTFASSRNFSGSSSVGSNSGFLKGSFSSITGKNAPVANGTSNGTNGATLKSNKKLLLDLPLPALPRRTGAGGGVGSRGAGEDRPSTAAWNRTLPEKPKSAGETKPTPFGNIGIGSPPSNANSRAKTNPSTPSNATVAAPPSFTRRRSLSQPLPFIQFDSTTDRSQTPAFHPGSTTPAAYNHRNKWEDSLGSWNSKTPTLAPALADGWRGDESDVKTPNGTSGFEHNRWEQSLGDWGTKNDSAKSPRLEIIGPLETSPRSRVVNGGGAGLGLVEGGQASNSSLPASVTKDKADRRAGMRLDEVEIGGGLKKGGLEELMRMFEEGKDLFPD